MVRPRSFTDDEILDVARQCFIEHGPGVSTNTIADAVGVSQATLFKRFGTKHDLMTKALAIKPKVELIEFLHQGPTPEPIPEQLLRFATFMTAMFDRMLPCIMAMWAAGLDPKAQWEDPSQAPPIIARRALTAFFDGAVEQGRMKPGDNDARAMVFIGAVKELAFQQHMFRQAAPRQEPAIYAAAVVDTFWNGWAPEESA